MRDEAPAVEFWEREAWPMSSKPWPKTRVGVAQDVGLGIRIGCGRGIVYSDIVDKT